MVLFGVEKGTKTVAHQRRKNRHWYRTTDGAQGEPWIANIPNILQLEIRKYKLRLRLVSETEP
jgi:hypothetical protein